MQYKGYLVTNADVDGWHAIDYVCLHHNAEYLTEGSRQHNLDGHIIFPMQALYSKQRMLQTFLTHVPTD